MNLDRIRFSGPSVQNPTGGHVNSLDTASKTGAACIDSLVATAFGVIATKGDKQLLYPWTRIEHAVVSATPALEGEPKPAAKKKAAKKKASK